MKKFGCIKAARLLMDHKTIVDIERSVRLKARFYKSGKAEVWRALIGIGDWYKDHESIDGFRRWNRGYGLIYIEEKEQK